MRAPVMAVTPSSDYLPIIGAASIMREITETEKGPCSTTSEFATGDYHAPPPSNYRAAEF